MDVKAVNVHEGIYDIEDGTLGTPTSPGRRRAGNLTHGTTSVVDIVEAVESTP